MPSSRSSRAIPVDLMWMDPYTMECVVTDELEYTGPYADRHYQSPNRPSHYLATRWAQPQEDPPVVDIILPSPDPFYTSENWLFRNMEWPRGSGEQQAASDASSAAAAASRAPPPSLASDSENAKSLAAHEAANQASFRNIPQPLELGSERYPDGLRSSLVILSRPSAGNQPSSRPTDSQPSSRPTANQSSGRPTGISRPSSRPTRTIRGRRMLDQMRRRFTQWVNRRRSTVRNEPGEPLAGLEQDAQVRSDMTGTH